MLQHVPNGKGAIFCNMSTEHYHMLQHVPNGKGAIFCNMNTEHSGADA